MSYILEALKKDEATSNPAAAAALALAQSRPKRAWALWVLGIALLVNAAVLAYLFYPGSASDSEPSRNTPPQSQPQATREVVVRPRQRIAPPAQQAQRPAAPSSEASRQRARPAAPARQLTSTRDEAAAVAAPRAGASTSGAGRVLSPEQAAALNLLPPETAAEETPVAQPGETVIAPAQRTAPPPAAAPQTDDDRSGRIIQLAELPPSDRQDFPQLEFSTHIFADDPALRAVVVNSRRLNEGESIGEMVLRAVTEDGILVDYRGYRVAVSVIEEWN